MKSFYLVFCLLDVFYQMNILMLLLCIRKTIHQTSWYLKNLVQMVPSYKYLRFHLLNSYLFWLCIYFSLMMIIYWFVVYFFVHASQSCSLSSGCLSMPTCGKFWFYSSDTWSACYLISFLCLFQEDQAKPGQPGQAPRPVGAGNPARV